MECEKCQLPYMAGSAMTDWKCVECGKKAVHANTAHPKLCSECSEKLSKCENCLELLNI